MRAWTLAAWLIGAAMIAGGVAGCVGESGGKSSGNVCARAAAKLRGCGLATDGEYAQCDEPEGPKENCEANCFLNAPCTELDAQFCDHERIGSLLTCTEGCDTQNQFACGADEMVDADAKCDGFPDCSNGADEVGCPTFACSSSETVPADFECDGFAQCSNGADEASCMTEVFTCDNGETINASFQCDTDNDCTDSSDEAGCPPALELICN